MLNPDFLSSLNLNKSEFSQAEHIWKMLDNLAEGSPEDYQSFIKKNISEGLTKLSEEKSIKPNSGFVLTLKANLSKIERENSFATIDFQKANEFDIEKCQKKAKIFCNICYHDRIRVEINENKSFLYALSDTETDFFKGKFGIFFTFVVNTSIYKEKIVRNPAIIKIIAQIIKNRLKTDRNPLIKSQNASSKALYFYEIDENSGKILKKTTFKGKSSNEPDKIILEPQIDGQRKIAKKNPIETNEINKEIEIIEKKKEENNKQSKILIEEISSEKISENIPEFKMNKT